MKTIEGLQQHIEKIDARDYKWSQLKDWKETKRLIQLFMEQGEEIDWDSFLDIIYYLAKEEFDLFDIDDLGRDDWA